MLAHLTQQQFNIDINPVYHFGPPQQLALIDSNGICHGIFPTWAVPQHFHPVMPLEDNKQEYQASSFELPTNVSPNETKESDTPSPELKISSGEPDTLSPKKISPRKRSREERKHERKEIEKQREEERNSRVPKSLYLPTFEIGQRVFLLEKQYEGKQATILEKWSANYRVLDPTCRRLVWISAYDLCPVHDDSMSKEKRSKRSHKKMKL